MTLNTYLTDKSYPTHTEYSAPRSKFQSVLHYDQPFSRYKIIKNRNLTKWLRNDLKHLTVNSTLYTLNTHPLFPQFTVLLHDKPFSRYKVVAPNDPRMNLTSPFNCQKYPVHNSNTHQILLRFGF